MKKSTGYAILSSQFLFFLLLPIWLRLTNYLHVAVVAVVWFILSASCLFIVYFISKQTIKISKFMLHIVSSLYSFSLVILLYVRPGGQNGGAINLQPFKTIRFFLSGNVDPLVAFYNLVANIILFIPFGIYYTYCKTNPSWKKLLPYAICSISLIELIQYLSKRGSLDIDDLFLNVLGVLLGFFITPLFQKVIVVKS
ncbi:VanZ family protein [Metabacillus niabensis]|uniref:Glycopeptide antibiotics resistance protein n=1 Tax=Metabacillus niabensis TaxID=324854 RepID=A0ABT9Z555_9BACI|nr:VanZ family protein [Metabacillus niabensis]MDQ0227399.1 glycopeptide antibiotics resistance protein [Metabacillus niabensis]